jgi:glycerate dehydrogenase
MMNNIVFLDAYTLNPGDIDFRVLEELGSLTVYDRTDPIQTEQRCRNADIVIVNKFKVDDYTLSMMSSVRYIAVAATGYNNIEITEVTRRAIPVSNVKGYGTASVAQYVMAGILSFVNRTDHYVREVRAGRWVASPDFCFYDHSIYDLEGRVMGIVGYGDIGRKAAQLAKAFGMKVLVHTRTVPNNQEPGIRFTDLHEVFRNSDVLSLHCPLTPETAGMVREDTLSMMKESALLVNTGRGALVREDDLYEALKSGTIAGALLDVLAVEPPPSMVRLSELSNCFITPHIAWASVESRRNLVNGVADNVRAFLAGQWINRVY